MEFKGTKGKWVFRNKNNSSFSIEVIDKSFAEVYVSLDADDIYEAKANALLISKAPEMLEMLQIYLADLNNIIPPSDAQRNRIQDVEQLIKEATEL